MWCSSLLFITYSNEIWKFFRCVIVIREHWQYHRWHRTERTSNMIFNNRKMSSEKQAMRMLAYIVGFAQVDLISASTVHRRDCVACKTFCRSKFAWLHSPFESEKVSSAKKMQTKKQKKCWTNDATNSVEYEKRKMLVWGEAASRTNTRENVENNFEFGSFDGWRAKNINLSDKMHSKEHETNHRNAKKKERNKTKQTETTSSTDGNTRKCCMFAVTELAWNTQQKICFFPFSLEKCRKVWLRWRSFSIRFLSSSFSILFICHVILSNRFVLCLPWLMIALIMSIPFAFAIHARRTLKHLQLLNFNFEKVILTKRDVSALRQEKQLCKVRDCHKCN